jgi:hypothetical protein
LRFNSAYPPSPAAAVLKPAKNAGTSVSAMCTLARSRFDPTSHTTSRPAAIRRQPSRGLDSRRHNQWAGEIAIAPARLYEGRWCGLRVAGQSADGSRQRIRGLRYAARPTLRGEPRHDRDGVIRFQHRRKIRSILIRNTVVPIAIRTKLFGD